MIDSYWRRDARTILNVFTITLLGGLLIWAVAR